MFWVRIGTPRKLLLEPENGPFRFRLKTRVFRFYASFLGGIVNHVQAKLCSSNMLEVPF